MSKVYVATGKNFMGGDVVMRVLAGSPKDARQQAGAKIAKVHRVYLAANFANKKS